MSFDSGRNPGKERCDGEHGRERDVRDGNSRGERKEIEQIDGLEIFSFHSQTSDADDDVRGNTRRAHRRYLERKGPCCAHVCLVEQEPARRKYPNDGVCERADHDQ